MHHFIQMESVVFFAISLKDVNRLYRLWSSEDCPYCAFISSKLAPRSMSDIRDFCSSAIADTSCNTFHIYSHDILKLDVNLQTINTRKDYNSSLYAVMLLVCTYCKCGNFCVVVNFTFLTILHLSRKVSPTRKLY